MPVFHYQDLFSCGSHLKGFPDPTHSDQLRKYFEWDQNKEDRRPTCESVCHKRAKPRLWGSIFVYTAPFTPRHLHQGLHHHSNIHIYSCHEHICPQWSVLEMWPTSFWAKLSPGANYEQEFPRTFCSPGFYLWQPYHHPWAGPIIIHAILTKISMWIPVAPPVRAAETHGN